MTMAWFFSGGVAICNVLPVLWMTSCVHIIAVPRLVMLGYAYNSTTVLPGYIGTTEHC